MSVLLSTNKLKSTTIAIRVTASRPKQLQTVARFEKNDRMTSLVYSTITSIERELRIPQIRGAQGEAVVYYCEPLATKEMEYPRFSRRVNKMEIK